MGVLLTNFKGKLDGVPCAVLNKGSFLYVLNSATT